MEGRQEGRQCLPHAHRHTVVHTTLLRGETIAWTGRTATSRGKLDKIAKLVWVVSLVFASGRTHILELLRKVNEAEGVFLDATCWLDATIRCGRCLL
jgi:hypothetical protein